MHPLRRSWTRCNTSAIQYVEICDHELIWKSEHSNRHNVLGSLFGLFHNPLSVKLEGPRACSKEMILRPTLVAQHYVTKDSTSAPAPRTSSTATSQTPPLVSVIHVSAVLNCKIRRKVRTSIHIEVLDSTNGIELMGVSIEIVAEHLIASKNGRKRGAAVVLGRWGKDSGLGESLIMAQLYSIHTDSYR